MVPTLFAMFEFRLHLINEAADGKCQAYFGRALRA
jgi:hypothetical protein